MTMHEIRLVGLPLALHTIATEHSEELQREFALLSASATATSTVPDRLIELIRQLTAEYHGVSEEPARLIDEAIERGDTTIELVYHAPEAVAEACLRLLAVFDEADEFCREGDHLLTLETPEAGRAYRTWFLSEFVQQVAGSPPTPWEDWARVNAPFAADGP